MWGERRSLWGGGCTNSIGGDYGKGMRLEVKEVQTYF